MDRDSEDRPGIFLYLFDYFQKIPPCLTDGHHRFHFAPLKAIRFVQIMQKLPRNVNRVILLSFLNCPHFPNLNCPLLGALGHSDIDTQARHDGNR